MKKIIKTAFFVFISLMIMASTVSASGNINLKWRGDYSDNTDPKLVFTFTSPVNYIQQFTAVIYPATVTNPTFGDYTELKEITVNGGIESNVSFNITNGFDADNGLYTARFLGNGYMAGVSAEYADVYVISPDGVATYLNRFASADSSEVAILIEELSHPLQLDSEPQTERKSERVSFVLSMKNADFGGAFSTLEDVRNAWTASDVLAYINKPSATVAGLKEKISKTSDIFGIDTEDADYVKFVDELCADILLYNGEYNNGNGINSIKEFKDIVGECLGVIVFNNSSDVQMSDAFAKYKAYLDITDETMADYNALSSNYQGKVLRELYNKNFAKSVQVVSAFTNAVGILKNDSTPVIPPVVIVPDNGTSSSGSGGGAGMTGAASDVFPTTKPEENKTTGFSDCTISHWAYQYVSKLSEKNIINGYDDNTFRPDNNVTREEFVKMIINATGLYRDNHKCEFSDVPETAWFYNFVASAYEQGIVSGMDDETFGVGTKITRQDAAVIASRVLTYMEKDIKMNDAEFTDMGTVSDYAKDSVNMLSGMGIINGFDDASFRPYAAITRAEAATIIAKLILNL